MIEEEVEAVEEGMMTILTMTRMTLIEVVGATVVEAEVDPREDAERVAEKVEEEMIREMMSHMDLTIETTIQKNPTKNQKGVDLQKQRKEKPNEVDLKRKEAAA